MSEFNCFILYCIRKLILKMQEFKTKLYKQRCFSVCLFLSLSVYPSQIYVHDFSRSVNETTSEARLVPGLCQVVVQ